MNVVAVGLALSEASHLLLYLVTSVVMTKLRVREIRNRKRLSQRALGARVGMSAAALSRIEHGRVDPRLSTLERLASALDVPVGKLLG